MKQISADSKNHYFLSERGINAYYDNYFTSVTDTKKLRWDIFVLINRKGYWDYKIFYPNGVKGLDAKHRIVSDRYLEKTRRQELVELFKDKVVIVYDDALSNGSNLFYYFLLCKSAKAKKVVPVVYALNSEFPSSKSYRLMSQEASRIKNVEFWQANTVDGLIAEFVNELESKVLLTTSDIDRLSIWQTELFQKHVCPLVMDLPIMNHIKNGAEKMILLSTEQFGKLCQNTTEKWEFVENEMRSLRIPIKASYFRNKDILLEQSFHNLFHDFVVKCKYLETENFVKVVFTPFAIVKSITFKSVYECFMLFYDGTPYAHKVLENCMQDSFSYKEMEEDDNLCKALFRAVIYRVSDYIGRKFQKYVKETVGLDMEYDWDIMKDNFDYDFIETQKELYQSFNEESFEKLLSQVRSSEEIFPIGVKTTIIEEKVKPTQERVNIFIRDRVIEKKKNINLSLHQRIYTLEAIEYELGAYFDFEDLKEKKRMITSACLLLLETNSFSNYILVDSEEHVLFRGFRYGENSEILLHDNMWFFFAYLYAFYNNVSSGIMDKYDSFMQWLESFLIKRGYLGIWISEDGFRFLKDYFGKFESEKELSDEIRRRRYLLDCDGYGKETEVRAKFIREAAHIVEQWGKA